MADLSFLADACALIVYHGRAAASMTKAGRQAMQDGDVFVSPITVWEITRKFAMGKLARPMPRHYVGSFSSWLEGIGYRVMPLAWDDCEVANELPDLHKDPMDRMLIASALRNDLTIITNDRIFAGYGVATVW